MEFNQENKKKIIDKLNNRIKKQNPNFKCPICNNVNFNVVDGYTRKQLNKQVNQINLGGPNIPSISIVCSNCGYIAEFAIGALGFLEKPQKKGEGKNDSNKN